MSVPVYLQDSSSWFFPVTVEKVEYMHTPPSLPFAAPPMVITFSAKKSTRKPKRKPRGYR